ncbi:MAG TPA: ABC transporter permease [Actinomycetota bacterium]|nr:ABC transporter permease [Actinomycetota bacterium]
MKVLAIGLMNLKRVSKDPTALFFMIALPVVITLLIGVAIFDAGAEGVSVGVVDQSKGEISAFMLDELDRKESVQTHPYEDADSLRRAVRREEVAGGIVIPAGFDSQVKQGARVEAELILNPRTNSQAIIRDNFNSLAARVAGLAKAAAFASGVSGKTFEESFGTAKSLEKDSEVASIRTAKVGTAGEALDLPNGFSYTAPANLVLAVFISAMAASAMLIESRRIGVTRRMLAAPLSTGTVLMGETLGRFLISFLQALIIFVIGVLVFGVNFGDPFGAILLLTLVALAGTAIAMLVGSLFRTPEQASAIGPALGIGMGMLSGCMWPLEIVSPGMRAVGHIFPQAWAMDGYIKLIARGAGAGDIALELLVLVGFVAVILPLAAFRLRRAITA